MTIYDIKLALYVHLGSKEEAIPEFVFLGRTIPPGKRIIPVNYQWFASSSPTETVSLHHPANLMKETTPLDSRFVESNGERRVLGITNLDRMTIEEVFLKTEGATVPTLHAYLYSAVEPLISGERPLSELSWNGRLYPYFPQLSLSKDRPSAEQIANTRRFAKGFSRRRQFYGRLEEILESGEPLLPINMTGVKFLRLLFVKPKEFPGIEAMFYEVPVNARRPYMRLLPADGNAISKIHMIKERPNIQDPRLLTQWSQERSPTPSRDFAMAKILLRQASGNLSPLYFTMRLLDDGSADVTIEPPRGIRKLDPREDLDSLPEIFAQGIQGLPYLSEVPILRNGMFIFGMNVTGSAAPFTQKALRDRLPLFSSVFQEIPALPGEQPLLMLRYKLISNFVTEDRIQTYITQLISRKVARGEADEVALPALVAEDFEITVEEARKRVIDNMRSAGKIALVNAETKEYAVNENPGIDIAIFAQHPFYSFHMYRVDSIATLRRIITFLSILFSKTAAALQVEEGAVREVLAAVTEAEPEFENVEEDDEFENVDEENIERAGKESEPVPQVTAEESGDEDDGDYDMDEFLAMGTTLEEENTARNVRATIKEEEEAPIPVEEMRTKLVADRTAVREDVERAPQAADTGPAEAVPASAHASAQKRAPLWKRAPSAAAPSAQPAALAQKKGLTDYFSSKLMEAEAPLFDYTKSHPSVTKYVSQCQANLMRQPAVLSQEKYEQMLKEYDDVLNSDPPQMKIYEFPLDKDAKKEPYKPTGEYYSVMKYGISERRQNYYLCCKYWCARDEILVREKELRGTTLRRPVKQADGSERTTKAPDTCPFCEGTIVKNRTYPGVNETIIERLGTDGGRQYYINFLKKTHPEGYSLPCCFKTDQPIRTSDKAFQTGTTAKKVPTFVTEEDEEDTIEIDETGGIAPEDLIIYEDVLIKTKYTYIVGSEKFPLDAAVKKVQKVRLGDEAPRGPPKLALPQIGMLPPELDSYFSQVSKELVVRTIKQTLKPGAEGFLRVGVENRKQFRNDSFLAAAAPFFGKSSARTMKQFLSDIIQPRIFMAMNYGNLAIEMYKPGLPRPKISERLKAWAKNSLRVKKITVNNKELVLRAYMSYSYFKTWLDSDDEVKEYRQFAHLFAQPGILQTGVRRITESGAVETEYRRPGVIFIVLDLLESGEVRTRCPPYPINKELFSKCDIGFLFHHYSGIWEPIFYADNRTTDERDIEAYFLIFSNIQRPKWPKIVEDRLREFSNQCASRTGGRGIYTSLAGVPSNTIIGATMMRQALESDESLEYYGLMRDAYNHISALIYKGEGLVAIPVVDDGLTVGNQDGILVMDWDDFEPATIEQTVGFYARHIEPRFPRLYAIRAAVVSRGSEKIEAVQLTNNLYIPVLAILPDALPETVTLPIEEITEMEWTINRRIAIGVEGAQQVPGDEARLEIKQFTEVYEHLRLIFSNWLASLEDGGEFRDSLEYTINRPDLPLFEKRRVLEIMLGSTIESWLVGPGDETENVEHTPGLLRMDCRLRPQSECSGMCSWIQSKEKCLLHVPAKSPIPDTDSAVRVLVLRLIEELIRFGGKRKEIFNQRVSQLALLENPIRMDDQYILPERSAKWAELLRLEWSLENPERPKFLEEMSRAPTAEETAAASATAPTNPSELPESLIAFLGTDDPAIGNLQLYPSQTGNLEPFLSYLGTTADAIGLPPNATEFTEDSLTKFTRITKYPTVQIDLRSDTHIERQLTRDNKSGYAVFVIQDGRPPSLLVRNVEEPKVLEMAELPEVLKAIVTSSKKIFVMTKRV